MNAALACRGHIPRGSVSVRSARRIDCRFRTSRRWWGQITLFCGWLAHDSLSVVRGVFVWLYVGFGVPGGSVPHCTYGVAVGEVFAMWLVSSFPMYDVVLLVPIKWPLRLRSVSRGVPCACWF
jgi:hypothetical protein